MGGRGASGVKSSTRMSIETHGGLTYVTQDYGGGYGRVGVLNPAGGEAGAINWENGHDGPVVGDINVREKFQGRGIGRQLWQQAQKATGGSIRHSANRTEAGDAFARKVGGVVPARSSLRPT